MMDITGLISNNKFGLILFSHVLFAFAVTKTKQQDSFYFDPAPINQDAIEGEEVRMRCDVSNRKLIMFYWTLNNKQLTNTSRRFQEETDLRIMRVDRVQDAGSFRCIATNTSTGIALRSIEAKINIMWIDRSAEVQLVKPKPEEVAEGTEITLKCQADGHPEPTVEWFRNKVRLFGSDRIRFTKNRVRILNITAADNGVYSCRARNLATTAESSDVYLLNVPGADGPRLKEDTFTRVLLVKQRNPAVFNCQYTNAIVTEWYFANNSLIANGTAQRFMVMKNGSLLIRQVLAEDAGVYFCAGVGEKGPVQTFSSELLLAYLDDLRETSFEPKPSTPQVIPVNGKFDIRCQIPPGLPVPVQRWENPYGMEITDQGRIKAADGVLSLTNVEVSDGGNYTCHVENLSGSKSRRVEFVVAIPPKISRPPLSVRVTEGEVASFDCRVIGTPFPVTTISWHKEDAPIDPAQDARYVINPSHGTLRIEDVQMTDEGNYACRVNTTSHPVILSANAHLYVEKQLKFRPVPVSMKLELGSNSTLRCRAEGRVPPRIRWYKDGHSSVPEGSQDADGTLHFVGVKQTDRGQYTCIASSDDQGVINATIEVDVVVKPKFKVRPLNTTAFEGYSTMLHCVATGDPLPIIQWDKNNKVNGFDPNRFKVLSNGSLHISEIFMEDVGKYGCTAGNSGGFEREEVYLHVSSGGLRSSGDGGDGGAAADNFNMMKTIIIAVCSAVAYLAIVIGLTVYCSIRLLRAKNIRMCQSAAAPGDKGENGTIPNETTELVEKKDHLGFTTEADSRSVSAIGSHSSSHQSQNYPQGTLRLEKDLAFPRSQLLTLGKLGRTYYGDVFLAKAHGIRDGEQETLVVIKSLVSQTEPHRSEFYREIEMFRRLNHPHIVPLLGLCKEMEPTFVIYEYCERGDMKQFLLHMRKDPGRPTISFPPLNLAQMLGMCSQIASAMEYLSTSRCVHRDLAARNILLTPNLDLKVACLALCRDAYSRDYFPQHQQLIPLRWMAPEAVLEAEFSTKSDVWSFGAFVWEVFTHAEQPYANRSDEDLLKEIMAGGTPRLDFSPNCPTEVRNVIQKCTTLNPRDRPDFSELVVTIGSMVADSHL